MDMQIAAIRGLREKELSAVKERIEREYYFDWVVVLGAGDLPDNARARLRHFLAKDLRFRISPGHSLHYQLQDCNFVLIKLMEEESYSRMLETVPKELLAHSQAPSRRLPYPETDAA
jgi:hypothetical protein